MLHCVHQNHICLLLGAEQVEYNGFLVLFSRQQLHIVAENNAMRAVRGNKNNKVTGLQATPFHIVI